MPQLLTLVKYFLTLPCYLLPYLTLPSVALIFSTSDDGTAQLNNQHTVYAFHTDVGVILMEDTDFFICVKIYCLLKSLFFSTVWRNQLSPVFGNFTICVKIIPVQNPHESLLSWVRNRKFLLQPGIDCNSTWTWDSQSNLVKSIQEVQVKAISGELMYNYFLKFKFSPWHLWISWVAKSCLERSLCSTVAV